MDDERVVLLDDEGRSIGDAPKSSVHGTSTPLHLGFSCYLLDASGRVLVTRRALAKLTWPGVWTNSFCGHPAPHEPHEDAVRRRAQHELGADLSQLKCPLPDFRYRAVDADGIEENEICPVFIAHLATSVQPNKAEVAECAWVDPAQLAEAVTRTPFAFSPWMCEQLPLLLRIGAFEGRP